MGIKAARTQMRSGCGARCLAILAVFAAGLGTVCSRADVLYDNGTAYTGKIFSWSGYEFGDEVTLAGDHAIIEKFKFQYYVDPGGGLTGNEKAEVFFRINDGIPYQNSPSPGTLIYDSGTFDLRLGFRTVTITGISIPAPHSFTWTVRFTGLSAGQSAGLLFFDPPDTGSSQDDFWKNSALGWTLQVLDGGAAPANFAARIEGRIIHTPPPMSVRPLPASMVLLTWPATEGELHLQQSESLNGGWRDCVLPIVQIGGQMQAIVRRPGARQFYRLVRYP